MSNSLPPAPEWLEAFAHALAGMCGGITATAVFYPLDQLRMRQQVEDEELNKKDVISALKTMIKEEGLLGWYRGLQSSVVSIGCSNLVYFYWYELFKKLFVKIWHQTGSKNLSNAENLIIASIAGSINVIITNPIWVVNTRLKLQKSKEGEKPLYKGTTHGIYKVWKEEGIEGLWKGVIPSLALVSNPAIQFAAYERIKRIFIRFYGKQPSALNFFFHWCIGQSDRYYSHLSNSNHSIKGKSTKK